MAHDEDVAGSAPPREMVVSALDPLRTMLEADGYALDVSVEASTINLGISAGEACGECLVPRTVLDPMVRDMLVANGIDTDFVLRYPEAHVDG